MIILYQKSTELLSLTAMAILPGRGPFAQIETAMRELTNPKSKSKVQVQVRADDWVFIKIRFSNHPTSHPAGHPGKFQRSKIELYFQNKSC